MKLSKVQEKVLGKMEIGVDYSAYDLGCSLATLIALEKKDLIAQAYMGIGSFYSPRTDIEWQIIDWDEK